MTSSDDPARVAARGARWDERYSGPDWVFGTDPAAWLVGAAAHIPAGGRVLCLADGDGRNSVWLAGQGFDVTAMDASGPGVEKARRLAEARGVSVDHRHAGLDDWDWVPGAFDAVAGIFMQVAGPARRAQIHAGIARTLRPGGVVLLHGYAPRQVGYGTGGPPQVENLYTLEGLAADFPGWRVLEARDYDAELSEGTHHVGRSALIGFAARKPG